MFCSWERGSSHPCNLLLALGAGGGVAVIMALCTEDGAPLLEEAPLLQDRLALRAGELFWVPGASQSHQVAAPGPAHSKSTLQSGLGGCGS